MTGLILNTLPGSIDQFYSNPANRVVPIVEALRFSVQKGCKGRTLSQLIGKSRTEPHTGANPEADLIESSSLPKAANHARHGRCGISTKGTPDLVEVDRRFDFAGCGY